MGADWIDDSDFFDHDYWEYEDQETLIESIKKSAVYKHELLSITEGGVIRLINEIEYPGADIQTLVISDQANLLAFSSSDCIIHLWDLKDKEPICDLIGLGKTINIIKFSKDGRLIIAGEGGGGLNVWDVIRRKIIYQYNPFFAGIRMIDISNNGRWILFLSDYLHFVDLEELLLLNDNTRGIIYNVSFAPEESERVYILEEDLQFKSDISVFDIKFRNKGDKITDYRVPQSNFFFLSNNRLVTWCNYPFGINQFNEETIFPAEDRINITLWNITSKENTPLLEFSAPWDTIKNFSIEKFLPCNNKSAISDIAGSILIYWNFSRPSIDLYQLPNDIWNLASYKNGSEIITTYKNKISFWSIE